MKEIELSGKRAEGRVMLVDDEIWEIYGELGKIMNGFVPVISLGSTSYGQLSFPRFMNYQCTSRFHHVAWKIHCLLTGKEYPKQWDKNSQINHINQNKLDNRIENLEVVTHAENMAKVVNSESRKQMYEQNSRARGGSVFPYEYKEGSVTKRGWVASVHHFKKRYQKKFGKNREAEARAWASELTSRLNSNALTDDLLSKRTPSQRGLEISKTLQSKRNV